MDRTLTSKRLPCRSRVLHGLAWVCWALASLTVCKTAAQAEAVQICPDPPPKTSFWRGLRRVVCIRNLVPGTGFSCFQCPRCRAPRRLQKVEQRLTKPQKPLGFSKTVVTRYLAHEVASEHRPQRQPRLELKAWASLGMSAGRASSRAADSSPNQNLQGAR